MLGHRLRGIILVSTFVTPPNLKIGKFLPWTLGLRLVRLLYRLRVRLSSEKHRRFIQAISNELQKVKPEVLAFRIREVFSVDAQEELRTCAVPIVYLLGTRDVVVPSRNLAKIKKIKPTVRIVRVKSKHFL